MTRWAARGATVALLFSVLGGTGAGAGSLAEGFFSVDGLRLDVRHVVAFRVTADAPEAPGNVHLYLSDFPLDAAVLAAEYAESGYEEGRARAEADAAGGGFVQICITAEGGECMLSFHHHSGEQFRRGELGELSLQHHAEGRVSGRWKLEGEDVTGRMVRFDLRFDAPVLDLR